ncbi:MAG: mandelate racemase/muconate lactonizing enzyme family protein [Armatimonadetes bacterium]|nr:mandelate racemase/muconate lactonizing enzyme family protein [Armatimonadota bacterium]
MKITRLETLCLSRPHEPSCQWFTARYRSVKADCAIVIAHTDAGLAGIGEASAYGVPSRIKEWVDWLAPAVVGRDPFDLTAAPGPCGRNHAYDTAVAGIDCALWDLRGKIEGKRVCELLSPSPPDKVRLYASSGCRYDWRERPEQVIDEAMEYIALGYTAMKFRIGTEWEWDGITVDRFLELVRALARAVNGRMELMLDGNCRLTEEQALPIARELDALGFAWFEEPIPYSQIDGYARLAAAVEIPISGGESFATLEQFRPYLERKAYDIVQPDAGLTGLTEAVKIARVAAHYGAGVCPHSWHNGLMAMANAHYVASLEGPGPRILEICMIQGPLQWDILSGPPPIANGWLSFPAPGLGVELNDGLTDRFPYVEGPYGVQVERRER